MESLVHAFVFLVASAVIWFFAGLLIQAVNRFARRFNRSGFTIAFFVLGFLTSISEISVAVNATVDKVPQISVGNLVGASYVILFLIVPILAVLGKGIQLKHSLSRRNLAIGLVSIALPPLFLLDGNLTPSEGLLALVAYFTLLFAISRKDSSLPEMVRLGKGIWDRAALADGARILIGATFIFIAGHFLVEQAAYFSDLLDVPGSVIGLILLSIGTNVPELVIAFRSILSQHKEIAFGDYVGSAATNTLIFGLLPIASGGFPVDGGSFLAPAMLTVGGVGCFYLFARSKSALSAKEGLFLFLFYVVFLLTQALNVARFGS